MALHSPLVGRDSELDLLRRNLADVITGTSRVVVLHGEAGVGKSRLVAEIKTIAVQQGVDVLQGTCFQLDVLFPYAPLIDLLRFHLTATPAPQVVSLLGPLTGALLSLLPELQIQFPDLPQPPPLPPEAEKRRLFAILSQVLLPVATKQPRMLIIEDMHWADPLSLEFLQSFLRRSSQHAVLVLLTYRTEDASRDLRSWIAAIGRQHRLHEISLQRLLLADVAAMVSALFGMYEGVIAPFLHTLFALTDGNPFFVEEILQALLVSGGITYVHGTWERKPLSELQIPGSIQSAVHARTLRLSTEAQSLCTLAAVAGRRFDFAVLQRTTGHDERRLLLLIKELITAQLVVEESSERFAFRHALTRQAIYTDLLQRERRLLHADIAAAIEHLYGDVLDPHLSDLAEHFYAAEAWEHALVYAQHAGEQALRLHAPHVVVEQMTRALEAAERLHRTPPQAVYRNRGQAHAILGNFDHALADHLSALELADATADARAAWQALLDLATLWSQRDYRRVGEYCLRARELATMSDDPALLAHSMNRIGNWHVNAGQPADGIRDHLQALAIFQQINDAHETARTLDLLAMAYLLSGDVANAFPTYERAIAGLRAVEDWTGLAECLSALCWQGPAFAAHGEEAIGIARMIGARSIEAYALCGTALHRATHGDYARALPAIRTGLSIAEEIGHREWTVAALWLLSMVCRDLLAPEQGRAYAQRALALAHEIHSTYWVASVTTIAAAIEIQDGNRSQAEAILETLTSAAVPEEMFNLWKLLIQPEIDLAQGAYERAIAGVGAATALLDSGPGAAFMTALMHVEAGALFALGRLDEAEVVVRRGLDMAERNTMRATAWPLQIDLVHVLRAKGVLAEAKAAANAAELLIRDVAATLPEPDLRDHFLHKALRRLPALPTQTPLQARKQKYGGLTAREREVALLVASGASNRAIAAQIAVSIKTVETHISHILTKLAFTSRVQIAAWAVEQSLNRAPVSSPDHPDEGRDEKIRVSR
jgi:DNA-binding CsgD family transcriptional regulator/tetratricopeptide (TPR) repeat protein